MLVASKPPLNRRGFLRAAGAAGAAVAAAGASPERVAAAAPRKAGAAALCTRHPRDEAGFSLRLSPSGAVHDPEDGQ